MQWNYSLEAVRNEMDSTKYYKTIRMYRETTLRSTWVEPARLVDPVSALLNILEIIELAVCN